ncbi:hypothetical protein OAL08_05260 [Akkermansiaceae bacterium]|nr:hypothetical protein [Akkermansiaceae bacterium]
MARPAVVREDRADITVEFDWVWHVFRGSEPRKAEKETRHDCGAKWIGLSVHRDENGPLLPAGQSPAIALLSRRREI